MAIGVTTIFGLSAAIFATLTEIQKELLKWRVSDDAKKYYSRKENKIFYKALKKGDTSVIDAIRAEKDQRINNYLNKLKQNDKEERKDDLKT